MKKNEIFFYKMNEIRKSEFLSKNDPHHGCFKTIFQLGNIEDAKVGAALGFTGRSLCRNYNGKPYLSNNSHRVRWVSLCCFVLFVCVSLCVVEPFLFFAFFPIFIDAAGSFHSYTRVAEFKSRTIVSGCTYFWLHV